MTKSRDDEKQVRDPGRRKFLKGVGIAGAGAAIADHLWIETAAEEKDATPESLSGNRSGSFGRSRKTRTKFR